MYSALPVCSAEKYINGWSPWDRHYQRQLFMNRSVCGMNSIWRNLAKRILYGYACVLATTTAGAGHSCADSAEMGQIGTTDTDADGTAGQKRWR